MIRVYIKTIQAIKETTGLSTDETSLYKLFTELFTLSTAFMCTKQVFCEESVGNSVENFFTISPKPVILYI